MRLLDVFLIICKIDIYLTIQNFSMQSSLTENETTDSLLLLPPPTTSEEPNIVLKLGDKLKLDNLGPIIINSDGTTRRITNWDSLTKHEQDSTYRVISARNKRRLEELRRENVMNTTEEGKDVES